ncbi:MAG: cytochrome oxidase subunit III [Pikeienuella sp.]
MSTRRKSQFELTGWLIFVASALCYIAASIPTGDPFSIAGGVLFLVACIFFMVPMLRRSHD